MDHALRHSILKTNIDQEYIKRILDIARIDKKLKNPVKKNYKTVLLSRLKTGHFFSFTWKYK